MSKSEWTGLAVALTIVVMFLIGLRYGGRGMIAFMLVIAGVVGLMLYSGAFNTH